MTKEVYLDIRMPPNDVRAEAAVLGGILINSDAVYEVSGDLKHYHFYGGRNDTIYRTMMSMVDDGIRIDIITLTDRLKADDSINLDSDFVFYVSGLLEETPSSANIRHYKDIVLEKFVLRSTIDSCSKAVEDAYNGQTPIEDIHDSLMNLADKSDTSGFQNVSIGIDKALEIMRMIHEHKVVPGIPTGWKSLDKVTGGVHRQELMIIAGRPSMGKTAFALCLMETLAKEGLICAFSSLESGDKELGTRYLIQSKPDDDDSNYREGHVTDKALEAFEKRAKDFKKLPIHIDDSAGQTLRQISSRARRLKARHGLDVLVVDYLQLMSGVKAERRDIEVGAYSSGLKQLAKELDISVIALSQLSRKVEDRPKSRPKLSDLRESGTIEQDADTVAFLYRPEYYGLKIDTETREDLNGLAEVIIAKQRNGPTTSIKMVFIQELMRFEDRATSGQMQNYQLSANPKDDPF